MSFIYSSDIYFFYETQYYFPYQSSNAPTLYDFTRKRRRRHSSLGNHVTIANGVSVEFTTYNVIKLGFDRDLKDMSRFVI